MHSFTFEIYCGADGRAAWRVHPRTFEANRDNLSPQMFKALEFKADSRERAEEFGKNRFELWRVEHPNK